MLDMGIRRKLLAYFKIITIAAYPNKEELFEEHKILLSLLSSTLSSENCIEIIKKIKKNQAYKLFKLDKDPELLKTFFIKTVDSSTLETLLDTQDIIYSEQEEKILAVFVGNCCAIILEDHYLVHQNPQKAQTDQDHHPIENCLVIILVLLFIFFKKFSMYHNL